MKPVAIHNNKTGFHPLWIRYCEENGIPFKLVNCYDNDIIQQLEECHALMWHYSHNNPKDIIAAKQILFSLEHCGKPVFPNFKTSWHFDDKVGQKYLLESIDAPLVPSYVFYNKQEALSWLTRATLPKVWKLRGGAGSENVKLIKSRNQAKSIINQAFGKGFNQYPGFSNLKERWRKFLIGNTNLYDVIKGVLRLGYSPPFSKIKGKQRGYVYFQDFIPDNNFDIRIIVIENKAFALKRLVRKNDFRASGSGVFKYSKEEFDERCVQIAFDVNKKLGVQCLAYDFVYHNNTPLIVEISYGFTPSGYVDCPGYWDEKLKWYKHKFDPYGWMVEMIIEPEK
jgi:glutathione synthase/RimK-type ligase-like ATP-grasp enzyme